MLIKSVPIKPLPWQQSFRNRFENFHINFLKILFYFRFFHSNAYIKRLGTFPMFLINFLLILSNFLIFQEIQVGCHKINMGFMSSLMTLYYAK